MKNKIAKISFIILSIVLVLSTCMTVFALTRSFTNSENGLVATLSFNKQSYNANENIGVSLNVQNNNSYIVNNIQTQIILPRGIKSLNSNLTAGPFSLNAGESKVQEVSLAKVVDTKNNGHINSPQTGDNVAIYIAMMVVSAVALVVITVKKKWIHKKKVMLLVLCLLLVGTMTLTSVVNAEPMVKEFTVEGTIKYDGKDVVIKGKVTYTHEIYSKLQIDGADKGMYVEGDTVTITAEDAPEGKHFAGWTVVKGNVTLADKNSKTTTFVMGKEEVEIQANYEVNTYKVEVISGENGKVSPAGSVSVNYGENQEFTITANTGYHIENVEVDGVNKGNIDTYTFNDVKENHTIKATFALNICTIRYLVNGTVYSSSDIVLYDEDSPSFFSSLPGYHIESVEVDGVNKGKIDEYIFTNVKESHTIDVILAIDTFTITSTANAGGTITESATVDYGDSKTFTITPNAHYHIADVKVDGASVGAKTSYEFTNVTASHTIEATFAIDTFTITSSAGANGTITESATVNYGDSKTFTITPNTGYHIADVKVDGASVGAKTSYEFTNVIETHTIEAIFAIDTFTITTKTNDGGSITGNTTVNYNDNTTFSITPNTGYGVVDVKVDGTSIGAKTSYEFKNVVKSHTIEVIFGVTTEETFKSAVNRGGYVYLANDINLGEPFYEDANVKIYGGDYKVSGSRLMFSSGDASIESGYFNEVGIIINEYYGHTGYLAINGGFFEKILVDTIEVNNFILEINAGTIKKIYGYVDIGVSISIKGGTFYFDPTTYVNTVTHNVTKTKDAENIDIWVVTAR